MTQRVTNVRMVDLNLNRDNTKEDRTEIQEDLELDGEGSGDEPPSGG